ncbi:MAG: CRISPR-associated protein Csx19 [Bryobacterales bacterium]|nr:CRISPR-associated protein Csx19 [Bryobacteraceae bacterium]MDW8354575.1 CRISPR-associated protein Csx19 [Bryobacterales bacterium]
MPEAATTLAGATLQSLDPRTCSGIVAWVRGEAAAPGIIPDDLRWALLHSDDGVTWGRFERERNAWRLSDAVKSDLCPPVREEWLQQLRLFGPKSEVLIWREEGGLWGRILLEEVARCPLDDVLRPSEESRILLGDHVIAKLPDDFTHVGDRAGLQQVLPLSVSTRDLQARRVRLKVRHYWEQYPASGAVRIAATRLVEVFVAERS